MVATKRAPRPGEGRPTKYNKELADEICRRHQTASLLQICKADDMPTRDTIRSWLLDDDKKEFLSKYQVSSDMYADYLAESIEEIAENPEGDTQRDKLRIDARKWYVSKVMPKKYGDRTILAGDKDNPLLPTPIYAGTSIQLPGHDINA